MKMTQMTFNGSNLKCRDDDDDTTCKLKVEASNLMVSIIVKFLWLVDIVYYFDWYNGRFDLLG